MRNKFWNKKELRKSYKLIIIFLLIINVISPIIFMWLVEISMEFKEGILLTNGFINSNPIQIYHISAYLMVLSSIFTTFYAIYYLDKIFKNGK
ncbi:MAG: hypothetical protein AABW67_04255 [Nanoarchaeota archaeon]